jgi:hypothetical protein
MSPDCTCQGLNEHCMFCFGTGVVQGPRTIPPKTLLRQKRRRRSRQSSGVPTACPVCRCPVTKLSRHLRKAHSGTASGVSPTGATLRHPVTQEPSVQAPENPVIREAPIVSDAHDPKGGQQLDQALGKSTKSPTAPPTPFTLVEAHGFVRCPKCHSKIKKSKLAWHLQNVDHLQQVQPSVSTLKRRQPEREDTSGSRRPKANRTALRPDDLTNEVRQSKISRSTDASKDFAHAFRERGKYGSYPSHDDYGDEGKA